MYVNVIISSLLKITYVTYFVIVLNYNTIVYLLITNVIYDTFVTFVSFLIQVYNPIKL